MDCTKKKAHSSICWSCPAQEHGCQDDGFRHAYSCCKLCSRCCCHRHELSLFVGCNSVVCVDDGLDMVAVAVVPRQAPVIGLRHAWRSSPESTADVRTVKCCTGCAADTETACTLGAITPTVTMPQVAIMPTVTMPQVACTSVVKQADLQHSAVRSLHVSR